MISSQWCQAFCSFTSRIRQQTAVLDGHLFGCKNNLVPFIISFIFSKMTIYNNAEFRSSLNLCQRWQTALYYSNSPHVVFVFSFFLTTILNSPFYINTILYKNGVTLIKNIKSKHKHTYINTKCTKEVMQITQTWKWYVHKTESQKYLYTCLSKCTKNTIKKYIYWFQAC